MSSDLPSNCVVSGTPRAISILQEPRTPQNERQLPGGAEAVTQSISGNKRLQLEKKKKLRSVRQVRAAHSFAFPPGEPSRDRGALGACAQRCRRESLARVSQSVAGGSEGPLSGRGGCGTGCPPVER